VAIPVPCPRVSHPRPANSDYLPDLALSPPAPGLAGRAAMPGRPPHLPGLAPSPNHLLLDPRPGVPFGVRNRHMGSPAASYPGVRCVPYYALHSPNGRTLCFLFDTTTAARCGDASSNILGFCHRARTDTLNTAVPGRRLRLLNSKSRTRGLCLTEEHKGCHSTAHDRLSICASWLLCFEKSRMSPFALLSFVRRCPAAGWTWRPR